MPARVTIRTGDATRTVDCADLVTIGRDAASGIHLEDLKVSRNHAMVRRLADGGYYLMDLGSANGTQVNGKRILVPHALANGDEILLGSSVLRFEQDDTIAPTTSTRVDTPTLVTMGHSIHTLTVLVTDIRDYTVISEQVPVDFLAGLLGKWFRTSSSIVERHGGAVDKFIGDAVMARWVAAQGQEGQAVAGAFRAAREMLQAAGQVNQEVSGLPRPFRIGVGINTGKAMLGTVGIHGHRDYTAVGDSVNLAFRFEALTRSLKADLVAGMDSCRHMPKALWEKRRQKAQVKGKDLPVEVGVFQSADLSSLA